MTVEVERNGNIATITLNRPDVRNAVDEETASELFEAFSKVENDPDIYVSVLWGKGGNFCAGADLKAISNGHLNALNKDMTKPGPMGPTRMQLQKPVIAAISGYAVAGGLELALWCDLRVAEEGSIFGVFNRRFGVPLIDGGTYRLPRIIGLGRALDLILTGRPISADEALKIGLINRIVKKGDARTEAENIAQKIASFPQNCLRSDREAVYLGCGRPFKEAIEQEFLLGLKVIQSGEAINGAKMFVDNKNRKR